MTAESQIMRVGETAIGLRCKKGHANGIVRRPISRVCAERNCGLMAVPAETWTLISEGDDDLIPIETSLIVTKGVSYD